MTVNHVFYIPLILAIGALIGAYLTKRQMHIQQARDEREQRLLRERKEERDRKRAAKSDLPDG